MHDAFGLRAWGVLLASVAVTAVGCAGSGRCASSVRCAEGLVCDPDGTCRALGSVGDERFARAVWLEPVAWGATRGAGSDAVELGEESAAYFAFELPGGLVRRAELVLTPHAGFAPSATVDVIVARTRSFHAGRVSEPPDVIQALGARLWPPGAPHAIAVDVTRGVLVAQRAGARRLDLSVRVHGARVRVSSPDASEPRARPRLELLGTP